MVAFADHTRILVCFAFYIAVHSQKPQEPSIKSSVHEPKPPVSFRGYGSVVVYPDSPTPTQYFNNKLDFETIEGGILIGAAEKLLLLSRSLDVLDRVDWTRTSSTSCTENPEYVCRNHIRVYKEVPSGVGGGRGLLMCGTQASSPECRTVEITGDRMFGSQGNISDSVSGLISAHPDLPGFGEFRRSSNGDMSFFGASFTSPNTRAYDLAYYNVSVDNSTGQPTSQHLYGYLDTTMTWLNFPVVFVDYRREDYPRPPSSNNDAAYHFYFVFLRENFQMDNREVLYSRVVRICRNDPGTTASDSQRTPIFSTYLKARIFCSREMPPGTEYVGAQDFEFNEIWSVGFNSAEGGRYYADGGYHRLMYGAFSGPLIGPPGTAICVYPAYPAAGQDTLNNGIFDIFQGDVAISNAQSGSMNSERQNTFVECAPQGRNQSNEAEDIQIIKDISQLGDNPLLILNGVHVSQMVVDQVCVVRRNNSNLCLNQDVLFLGTDTGLVYKVVMATLTPPVPGSNPSNLGELEPVVVDEIQLGDSNSVDELKLEMVDGVEYLYVGTASRIYRLPLENCARFGANFSECLGSRDPYCVWDSVNATCRRTNLRADGDQSGTVPSHLSQNIHTGMMDEPEVSFTVPEGMEVSVMETQPLTVGVRSSGRVSDGVLEMVALDGTARAGRDFDSTSPWGVNFSSNSYSTSVNVNIVQRSEFTGNTNFTLRLRSSGAGVLRFGVAMVKVTIIDVQAISFQLAIGDLGTQTCEQWIQYNPSDKMTAINNTILTALDSKPEEETIQFQQSKFSCTGKLSANNKHFAVYRSIMDISKLSSSRDAVINSLQVWMAKSPKINDGVMEHTVLQDSSCSLVVLSLDDPYCSYGNLVGDTGALGSGPANGSSGGNVTALSAIVGILAFALALAVAVIVVMAVGMFAKRSRRCYKPSSVGAGNGVKSNETIDITDSNGRGDPSEIPVTPNTGTELLKHGVFNFDTVDGDQTQHKSVV